MINANRQKRQRALKQAKWRRIRSGRIHRAVHQTVRIVSSPIRLGNRIYHSMPAQSVKQGLKQSFKLPPNSPDQQMVRAVKEAAGDTMQAGQLAYRDGKGVVKTAIHAPRRIISNVKSLSNIGQPITRASRGFIRTKQVVKKANSTARSGVNKTVRTAKRGVRAVQSVQRIGNADHLVQDPEQMVRETMRSAGDKTIRGMRTTVRIAAKAKRLITGILRITVRLVTRFLVALGGSGVLILVIVFGAVLLGLAAVQHPVSITLQRWPGSDGSATALEQVVRELNSDFEQDIMKNGSENIESIVVTGTPADWRNILLVYSVEASDMEDPELVENEKREVLEDIYRQMNNVTVSYTTLQGKDEAGESQQKMQANISLNALSLEDILVQRGWTADQMDLLEAAIEMYDDTFWDAMTDSLPTVFEESSGEIGHINSFVHEGKYCWPLPGYTSLSTYFGEPDAIYHKPHRGIDIPAPRGTPILAVCDGTVLWASYKNSWGNTVLIEHVGGFRTLYAHQYRINVRPGDRVKAGDVIGFVGSTGDSTGNHLHLEWWQSANSRDLTDPRRFFPEVFG